MKKPSFSKINYMLRPNKNVERKLLIEAIGGLGRKFDLSAYSYIGLGSMWFVDFILFHKILLIQEMCSIEKEQYSKRADFNRPYDCIEVKSGDTTLVLSDLNLENRQNIIWLDYDSGLDGPVMQDAEIVCEKAKSGSVFIITVNANHKRLDNSSFDDKIPRAEQRVVALKHYAQDFLPPGLKHKDIVKKFHAILATILFTKLKAIPKIAGRVEKFIPLFNIVYNDTSPMLTVGGIIANRQDQEKLNECDLFNTFECVRGEQVFEINVPHLTFREKTELDRMFPRRESPSVEEVDSTIGLPLEKEEIESYFRFYRYYPVFGELTY